MNKLYKALISIALVAITAQCTQNLAATDCVDNVCANALISDSIKVGKSLISGINFDLSKVFQVTLPSCPPGADITQLDLTPQDITVRKNFPDNGETMTLVAKIASQGTGGHDVLFLHGFPHSHLLWKNQLVVGEALRTQHNLYTLDLRGQGESDKPAPSAPPNPFGNETVYMPWENWANDLHETIQQLGLSNPVIVAHSAAGIFLNDYLRQFGDAALGGIVLVDTIPDPFNTLAFVFQWVSQEVLALAASGDLVAVDMERGIPASQDFAFFSTDCPLSPQDLAEILMYDATVPPIVREAIVDHDGLPPVGDGLPGSNDPIWASVTVPTKIIWGRDDRAVLFAAGEHLNGLIPGSQLCVLENVGHIPPLEAFDQFNSELLGFLNSI